MANRKDIPHLLSLIDDESEWVRDNVQSALKSFGKELEKEVVPYIDSLNMTQRKILDNICRPMRLETFGNSWFYWLDMEDDKDALEYALSRLAYLEYGYTQPELSDLLDQVATRFLEADGHFLVSELMHFLFQQEGYSAPIEDFYNPLNSNLTYVIQQKRGIQISLACLAILVGKRVHLDLYGLNMPGHFMVLAFERGSPRIYDCFNQGKLLPKHTIWHLERSMLIREENMDKLKAPTQEIILRVLRNLINAHFRKGQRDEAGFYTKLFEQLAEEIRRR